MKRKGKRKRKKNEEDNIYGEEGRKEGKEKK